MTEPHPSFSEEIGAALEWWQAAGVDCDFTDDATAWLSEQEANEGTDANSAPIASAQRAQVLAPNTNEETKAAAPTRVDVLGDSPPETLEAFREFWLNAPGLDTIGPRGRIAPRGSAGANLMILVVDPEEGDREALLSGAQGRLLDKMTAAMGFDEGDIYFASALPRHTPMADTEALAQAGLDAVLAHHVNLVAPQRIIAFGTNILPLLRHGVTKGETSLREINQSASPQGLLVSEGLDSLMAMPRLKARFWRRWIEWSADQ